MAFKQFIGVAAVISFLVWTVVHGRNNYRHLLAEGKKTVAVVLEATGKNMTVAFYANGTTHEMVLSEPFDGFYKGETFGILYELEDPVHAEVLFHEPVYDKQVYVSTQATAYGTINFDSFIEFEYRVGKKEFARFQAIHPDKTLVEGKPVQVFYNISNPEIAYLEY